MKKLKPYILCIPLMALLLIQIIGLVNALLQSLGYIPALGLRQLTLDYYREILSHPDFTASLRLSLFTALVSSLLSAVFGVAICAALCRAKRRRGALTRMVRIPVLIPHTVVALMLILLLSQSGMLSRLLFALGRVDTPADFPVLLYSQRGWGIILGYVWKQAPFVAYFTLALMESVSRTLEETAVNLGASPLRAFFGITLPLSLPAVAGAFFIILVFSFGAYELPYLLGATKPKALPVQAHLEYMHPDLRHRPYAMAMNGIIILVSLIVALVYARLLHKKLKGLKTNYDT